MSRVVLSVCAALLLVACERAPVAPEAGAPMPETPAVANDTPAGQRIEADVRTLADDRMEGRLTGSAGLCSTRGRSRPLCMYRAYRATERGKPFARNRFSTLTSACRSANGPARIALPVLSPTF